jgi:hypothetical protein
MRGGDTEIGRLAVHTMGWKEDHVVSRRMFLTTIVGCFD